jgi:hypothetical protein
VLAALASGALLVAPASAGAWSFDQTLGIWRDQAAPAALSSSDIGTRPHPQLAQVKKPLPTPIVERSPTNVEIVNKAINPGASDPNVPLPRANLPDAAGIETPAAGDGPRIYGRGEDGGAVLGFRVPIPADRNVSGATARYSSQQATPELSAGTQQR